MIRTEKARLDHITPDPNNPRREFGGLEELAEQFRFTPDRPGEPMVPPLVVEDGVVTSDGKPRYRIVDGERRYRAMLEAGEVESCLVSVADTMEEAATVAAMLATDDKQPLTDAERSQGVQTMLLLGVSDDEVEAVGRLKSGQARKIRSVTDKAGRALQTNMDVLIEISDVEDDAVRAELIELAEEGDVESYLSDFQRKLRFHRSKQKSDKMCAAFREWCDDNGIEVLSSKAGYLSEKIVKVKPNKNTLDYVVELGITQAYIEPADPERYWTEAELHLLRKPGEDQQGSDATAQMSEKEREKQAFSERMGEDSEKRRAFVFGFVKCPEPFQKHKNCAALRDILWKTFVEAYDLEYTYQALDMDPVPEYPAFLIPMLWDEIDAFSWYVNGFMALMSDEGAEKDETLDDFAAMMHALQQAGYTPSNLEREIMARIEALGDAEEVDS